MEKKEIENTVFGNANIQNVQGDDNRVQQSISSLPDMIESLRRSLAEIHQESLRNEFELRVDQIELESRKSSPDVGKLKRVKDFFSKHTGNLASVASLAIQIVDILMKRI
ncbi:MAG TPA: hypothetical protein ENN47_03800 [Mesotoga infera]|uniref:DUF4404 family protein n=1 Tax=Mesotoga infera TaxID=1236046 RepID=A0A7C1GZ97_9BACT|nr:hypothetical protein [Mesotoga infera]